MNTVVIVPDARPFVHYRRWSQLLFPCLLATILVSHQLSATENTPFRTAHISLEEAEERVQPGLSPAGRLTGLPSRSIPIATNELNRSEKALPSQQIDLPVPEMVLYLQILAVSVAQAPIEDGKLLPGGWILLPALPDKALLITRDESSLQPDSKIQVKVGNIHPIRPEIRYWLNKHGIADAPDLALHSIMAGFEVRVVSQKDKQAKLALSPWLRLSETSRITAHADIEVLTDLGTTNTPQYPPSTVAPMRLNIRPTTTAAKTHHIGIRRADTEVHIHIGEKKILLAYRHEALEWGNAILSGVVNGQEKMVILRLLLE